MTITKQLKWNKVGVGVVVGAAVYGVFNEDATAAADYYDGDHIKADCDLRDGYKPVLEVEEKHGGFTVYSER